MRKQHEFILPAAIVFFAALFRIVPVTAGLPYISYVDEGHVLHPAMAILKARRFDSTRFTYPPLTSYLTIAAATAYTPIYRLVHHRRLRQDLPRDDEFRTELGDNYDLIAPPEIIWLARLVIAALSIGTVCLAGAIARRCGGTHTALFAVLFTALCPALVSRGSIAIIDTTAAFFAISTVYFCQRLRAASDVKAFPWREAAFAGVAAGLAFGAKYTVGVVFVTVIIAIATIGRSAGWKVRLGAVASAGLILGIFCGVPAAVLHPAKIIQELHSQAAFYRSIRSDQNYWNAALSISEIGIPLLLAGSAGIGLMLLNRVTRNSALSWLGFATVFLSAIAWPTFQPFRNLLPLVPLLCIGAAFFFDSAIQYFERRTIPRYAPAAVLAVAILFVLPSAWASVHYLHTRFVRVDSRIQAIDWLQRQTTKEMKILGIRELAILPGEWKRLPVAATVVPWANAVDLLQQQSFDYIVTGEYDLRYLSDEARWQAYREQWSNLTAARPTEAVFGAVVTPIVPYLWRTNEERVIILGGIPQTR